MIEWKKKYATGIALLDKQHKELFRQLNELETLSKAPVIELTKADKMVSFSHEYVRTHFCFEENCVQGLACPFKEENKAEHAQFMISLERFEKRYNENGPTQELLDNLHQTATKWLHYHILKIDTKNTGRSVVREK